MKLLVSTRAKTDLLQIYSYLSDRNPVAAEGVVQRIDQKFSQLAELPFIGRPRPSLGAGLRSVVVGPHVIFYLVGQDTVTIVRVLDGRRDLDEELRR